MPTNAVESALTVVLPPGNYTAIVSGNGGTGIALLEVTDLRNGGIRTTAEAPLERSLAVIRTRMTAPRVAKAAPELCVGVPLTFAMIRP